MPSHDLPHLAKRVNRASPQPKRSAAAVRVKPLVAPREQGSGIPEAKLEHKQPLLRLLPWQTARVAALAIGLCGGGVVLSLLLSAYTPSAEAIPKPQSRADALLSIPRRVEAPGIVEAVSGMRNLSFDIPGRIKTVRVEEGQSVKAGQLVAELEDEMAAARLESARADLRAAQAKLSMTERNVDADILRAKKEVERLQAELALLKAGPRKEQIEGAAAEAAAVDAERQHAEEEETRYRDPSGKYESWSRQLFDQAHWRAQTLKARVAVAQAHLRELQAGARAEELDKAAAVLASAEAEVARQNATRQSQLDLALAQVAQANARVTEAIAAFEKTRLYAPINGAVVWKFMYGGEAIDAIRSQPVIAVADLSHLRIRASVDEADYPHVVKGQAVKITADAFGDHTFTGHVELIGSTAGEKPFKTGEPRERIDVRVIEALIMLDNPTPFKLGLRVTAMFEER
jgi:HlyD family secretion protein